ncbi:TLR4 interactor with leucine rich repeats [Bombina bombina]|uniref:TLR4 interactor with leucine rich repeats n=1 Tax=Bombina bombina TaxID=8345 RepID=UPI00235A53EF|nr:TLR4 interactor with leucine rich repeats [Bombina bombina]
MEQAGMIQLLILLACSLCWSLEHRCPEPCDCQHLQHILCSNRGLHSVPKSSHFMSSIGTKTFSLGGNFISNISAVDFLHFPQLQRLDLQYNQIHFIHHKAFDKLTHLEELYLGNNLLPSLTPGAFSPLRKLKVLNLNSNRLHNVSRACFSNLLGLIKLRLDSNIIHSVQGSPFSSLTNLLYLHLENNKIVNISKNAFVGLGKLRLLSLSGNPQISLRHPTFLPLRSLSTLNIAGNRLQQLGPDIFNGLQRLSRLILSSNRLTLLHSKAFFGLGSLQELHLDGNLLSQLPEGLLLPLHNLEVLNLSHNALSSLNPETFNGLGRLRVLDLQHNTLSYLHGKIFSGNPALYRLQLDGNQWICDCQLLGLKHWILGTLHPRSRMLSVFVQCWGPPEVAGKYLDYLDDSYQQETGGCISSTTPAGQGHMISNTSEYKGLLVHQPRKGDTELKTDDLLLSLFIHPSVNSSLPESVVSSKQASETKGPHGASRQQGIDIFQKEKSKDLIAAFEPLQQPHPPEVKLKYLQPSQLYPSPEMHNFNTFQPATETLNQLHLKSPSNESNKRHHKKPDSVPKHLPDHLQSPSDSLGPIHPGILDAPSGPPYLDGQAPKTLNHDPTTAISRQHDNPVAETLHQPHHDPQHPLLETFHHGQTERRQPASETLHQAAPVPSLLSDPCEFNKLYLLNLSVEAVGSSTARVRWQALSPHTRGPVHFRVLYERFGQSGRFQRFVYPRGHTESLTLLELTGDTPYLVCVESLIGGRACPVAPRDHCVGLVTLPSENSQPSVNYQMLALALLALNAFLLLLGLVAWGSKLARKKWGRRRAPVHVRQMYSTRRPYRSVGTGVSTDFSGFQSHRPRTAVCALGEADLIEFPGCDRFREATNIHREDLLQRFTD